MLREEPAKRYAGSTSWTYVAERQVNSRVILGTMLAAALLLPAAGLHAQNDGARWTLTPRSGSSSRVGVAAQPAQPVAIVPSPTTFFPAQPVVFTLLPAIVLSDGTVLADFGFGFEPVQRFCGQQVVVSGQPQVIGSNGVVLRGGNGDGRLGDLPPVPNQPTQSQLNLPSNQSRFPILTAASQTACWTRDGTGRFFVVR